MRRTLAVGPFNFRSPPAKHRPETSTLSGTGYQAVRRLDTLKLRLRSRTVGATRRLATGPTSLTWLDIASTVKVGTTVTSFLDARSGL